MPEVTDPELLAALNGSAPATGPIYGAPDPGMAFKVEDQVLQRRGDARAAASEQRAAVDQQLQMRNAQRQELEWNATHNPDGTPKTRGGKALADGTAKRIEGSVGQFSALTGSLGGFKDDYAGNLLGEAENLAQGVYSGVGTEGQRNWWANFRATDNVIRNELFGAALTPQEKASYESTTISPSLDPKIVRENLGKRADILKTALERQRRFMIANGYNQEAVDILYEPLRAIEQLQAQPTPQEEEEGLTGSVTDTGDYGAAPPTVPPTAPGGGGGVVDGLLQGVGSIVEGAASIPAIVVDPIATSLGRALGYDDYTSDFASQVRSDLGLPANQDRVANAVIGGGVSALTGSLAARGASALASGAGRNALAAFGATPARDAAAGAGAALGGIAGEQVGGTPGQIAGTLAGGIGGYGAASRIARGPGAITSPNALMQAADRQNISLLPADVGGTATRMAAGATGRTLGGIPMAEGAERSIQSAGRARDRVAGNMSDSTLQPESAGQAARRGFKSFENSSQARADELYERISVPAQSKVQLGQTRGALAEVTRGMQSNPELSKLWANHPRLRSTLEALTPKDVAPQGREQFIAASDELTKAMDAYQVARSNVTSAADQNAARQAVERARAKVAEAQKLASTPPEGGELSWQDMKRFRSIVGEIVGQPGVAADGSDVAGLRKLYAALSSDMEVSAAQAGPKALQEFRRATQYFRGRSERLDDVFSTLLGGQNQKSDEAVFRTINTWAQSRTGDFSRLARTIRSMPKDEADTVRATVVQRLGQAKAANGGEEVFSPTEFSTQWNSLSSKAKNVLFPNKQHRQDLEDIAAVSTAMKRADQYRNFSNTSLGVNLTGTGLTALAGPMGLLSAAAYSGATFSMGKLLASPRFARALATTKRMPEEQARRTLTEKLGVIAANDPGLRTDAKGLQDYLRQATNQSPAARAAASEQEQDRRREPPQQ